jgi:hypothetical protein
VGESNSDLIKHRVYLSHHVWGELKLRAFHERTSASDLVNYVSDQYLKERAAEQHTRYLQLTIHRSHDRDEDRQGRSVYFRPGLWAQLEALANEENFSISSLIENLLCIYLGMSAQVEAKNRPEELDPNRYVQVGGKIYDLGDNPYIIDASTGQPADKEPKGGKGKQPRD